MSDCCGCDVDTKALQAEQRRVLKIVLAINIATFFMVVAAAVYSGSSSLLSGGLDNFGDALSGVHNAFTNYRVRGEQCRCFGNRNARRRDCARRCAGVQAGRHDGGSNYPQQVDFSGVRRHLSLHAESNVPGLSTGARGMGDLSLESARPVGAGIFRLLHEPVSDHS